MRATTTTATPLKKVWLLCSRFSSFPWQCLLGTHCPTTARSLLSIHPSSVLRMKQQQLTNSLQDTIAARWLVSMVILSRLLIGRQFHCARVCALTPLSSLLGISIARCNRLAHPVHSARQESLCEFILRHYQHRRRTTALGLTQPPPALLRNCPPITTQWKIFHQTLLGYDHMVWKFIYLRKSFLIRPTADSYRALCSCTTTTGGVGSRLPKRQQPRFFECANNVNFIWLAACQRGLGRRGVCSEIRAN